MDIITFQGLDANGNPIIAQSTTIDSLQIKVNEHQNNINNANATLATETVLLQASQKALSDALAAQAAQDAANNPPTGN